MQIFRGPGPGGIRWRKIVQVASTTHSAELDTIQTETYFHSQLLTKNDLIPLNGNQE